MTPSSEMITKRCSCCGIQKSIADFNRNRTEPDGHQRWCKACRRKHANAASTRERMRPREAAYRAANREKLREVSRQWRAKHPARASELSKTSKAKNKENVDAYNKKYRETHRDEHRRANRNYYLRNKDKYLDHRLKRIARLKGCDTSTVNRQEVFERDEWRCTICGCPIDPKAKFPDSASASLDHFVPLSKGGKHTMENVFAAHLGCNLSKGAKLIEDA